MERLSDEELAELERKQMQEARIWPNWCSVARDTFESLLAEVRTARSILAGKTFCDRPELVDERDRLRARVEELEKELAESETTETMACAERDQAQSDLAAARAEVERLEDIRSDLLATVGIGEMRVQDLCSLLDRAGAVIERWVEIGKLSGQDTEQAEIVVADIDAALALSPKEQSDE